MQTEIVINCIKKALDNPEVSKKVENREKDSKVRIGEVSGTILKRKNNQAISGMIVRVGFNFQLKNEDLPVKEDVLVNVIYKFIKATKVESYQVKDSISVPEIE